MTRPLGARVEIAPGLFAQVNAARELRAIYAARAAAADAAVTCTVRCPR